MERHAFFLFATSAAFATQAHLAPDLPATLGRHLLEVNAQWSRMDAAAAADPRIVRFDIEAQRIAEHLRRVREHLLACTPPGLSAMALTHRRSLLAALGAYADRGLFPINNAVPGRSPVFIDDLGTACAVGQLMIVSGHADLAERIRKEMDLAYVHDMHRSDMDRWAVEHGFTEDELAWIQPTYEFREIRPQVLASLLLKNGDVLVVQRNAEQGMSVLRRTNAGDHALGDLPMLTSINVIEHDDRVYISGTPAKDGGPDLYEWDGTAWIAHLTIDDDRVTLPDDDAGQVGDR